MVLLFLGGGFSSPAVAQTVTGTTGAVAGLVTDSSTAAAPGVLVTLSGPALMVAAIAVSDPGGDYHFSAVPPGAYTVTFERAGFGRIVRTDVPVSVGFTAVVNARVSPAAVTATVDVRGGAAVVDPASTDIATHFGAEALATLPRHARLLRDRRPVHRASRCRKWMSAGTAHSRCRTTPPTDCAR